MRTMLLSLRPDVYENVKTGKKIYEHRKVFPDEPIKAYIYVSRPVQALAGVMILGNRTNINEWKETYSDDRDAQIRITEYLERHQYAMEIQEFQDTSQIPLAEIKAVFPKFLIPQMYYFIDKTDLLEYLEKHLVPMGEKVIHTFDSITSDQICKY